MTMAIENKQQGAVLVVSLILLLVMTMLGLSGMRTTTLEERMGGNTRNKETAFQAGEAVLREGESNLLALTAAPLATADGSTGVWLLDAPDPDTTNAIAWWKESTRDAAWWSANALSYSDTLAGVSSGPRYLVEEAAFVSDSITQGQQLDESGKTFYRVTARATGGDDLARVLLQSTYARRY